MKHLSILTIFLLIGSFSFSQAYYINRVSPNSLVSNAKLQVNFISFTATKLNDTAVSISWSAADEVNNNHFEIQRSLDGMNWDAIAIMFPELDANLHMYKYNDRFCSKVDVYYRIRQVDMNGGESFSKVTMIAGFSDQTDSRIYVSAKNTVTVDLKNAGSANVTVRLIGLNGRIIGQKSNSSDEKISLTAYNAIPGAYIVQVSDSRGNFSSKKVVL